jgi:hypothetical protein
MLHLRYVREFDLDVSPQLDNYRTGIFSLVYSLLPVEKWAGGSTDVSNCQNGVHGGTGS